MQITVKNVGELKKALENLPDEMSLRIQATGYDEECECDVSIDPVVDNMTIDLYDVKRGTVLEISNSDSKEMTYAPW